MLDDSASTSLDARIADPTPPSTQFRSRRELRQAMPKSDRDVERAKRRELAEAKQSRMTASASAAQRLRRSERAALRRSLESPKRVRRNPISALITMAVVGGMFGLAALPAYADFDDHQQAGKAADPLGAQTLVVPATATSLAPHRDEYHATSPEVLAQVNINDILAANQAAYLASGARELGDDYPWAWQLSDDQGGGFSPLNYVYRQCVDFVAWRINRDQGYYSAPFKWVWSNLTPYGGNGGQWLYNWQALGRTVSDVPIPGAVAYTGGNHIAYVKTVFGDGTVLLEEYNYVPDAYSQRIVPASSVVAFLYPPS